MRELADSAHIEQFMRELGRAVPVEGRVSSPRWSDRRFSLAGGTAAGPGGPKRPDPPGRQALLLPFRPVAQALSKIGRATNKTPTTSKEMIATGLVDPAGALGQFEAIETELRFPAIDPVAFRKAVEESFAE